MSESGLKTRTGLLAWLAGRPVPALILLCLIAWLPGTLSLPALDRDESRFAQASKQMLESGDYVDIHFSTVPRYNKPVGIYWAQAAATRLFGHPPYNQIWTYRLPSLLGGILAVLLTYWCGRAAVSREAALMGGALLALTLALSVEAEIATTDALLLATVMAVQGCLLRVYLHARGKLENAPGLAVALSAWAALGFGILLKGPVILAVVAVTAFALSLWDRDWRWFRDARPWSGIPVALSVILPWAIAIAVASHGAFYQRSLGHDFAAKILAGQETHGSPPGYYLALASVTLWPAILFFLPAIGIAIARRSEPVFRFLLAWAVPNWLLFELVPTKLPHYILPVYPALVLTIALSTQAHRKMVHLRGQQILRAVSAVLFTIVAVGAAAAAIWVPLKLAGTAGPLPVAGDLVLLACAGAALFFHTVGKTTAAIACALGCALVLYPLLSAAIAPTLEPLWMSRAIATRLARDDASFGLPITLAGYVEPSAVFLLGTNTKLDSGRNAGAAAARQDGFVAVEDHERAPFLLALHGAGGRERVVDAIGGFDYSRGRWEHVTIYRVTSNPTARTLRSK